MNRLLLCTDLDRTLLPNGPQAESPGARRLFARLAAAPGVMLAYVSGRGVNLVEQAIDQWEIPAPDLVIADVGATIVVAAADGWQRQAGWDALLAADWAGLSPADLHHTLSPLPDLTLQGEEGQGLFKVSYHTPAGEPGREIVRAARHLLAEAGVSANVSWSMDETTGHGLLDLLPGTAGKRAAIEHVRREWQYRPGQVFFAGDSGNDLDVLASPIPAVLVANARDEVREEARRLARLGGNVEALHLAVGGRLGMNGNYAAGILEGVLHFHPHLAKMLASGE